MGRQYYLEIEGALQRRSIFGRTKAEAAQRHRRALRVRDAGQATVSRHEVEAMVAAGTIEALPTAYTWMIPTSEIERLKH